MFDVALASAKVESPAGAGELIARYDSRWRIDSALQEAKAHGVGETRNRVQKVAPAGGVR